ncbi:M10 family metallopeptidase [Bradyrhizobium sp. JYMT SZCCT0428]|uniref:M10 family metallopeptidase n=1 Tax=Bradyrhizobium sp. JYMT SZCCT0428 TaxID=2807673 RepID=UPI001BA4545E|nr:M10 family metallopeptidase [Bradyrhizobium sp. JYMT SZCCT0428]MBR1157367.1 M10 family metallopeptidase C-terminal domain-containing protein [Bradyrhizobium sp. JYMT SZCCT0428]
MAKAIWTNSQIIDQLDSGSVWSGLNLTYGFPSSASWFPYAERNGFTPVTSAQQAAATFTIRLWDDLIGPDFALAANGATANVKYMNTTTNIGYAQAYYPSIAQSGGSLWFNSQYGASSGTNNLMSPTVGNWGWGTFIHETGHALGLDHPGNYNGGSPTYANDALYAQDSQMYTIMSYFTANNTGADWVADDGRTYYAETPMLDDVLVIQAMYGAETTTRTGNTVYGFNSNSDVWLFDFRQNLHPVLCIYDSAGTDTLDLSGWSYSCILNLAPGAFSSCDMMTYNISIAYGVIIENGIGGGGNDAIDGNGVGNQLSGLVGDDTITGGGGNDIIDGGTGNDTAVYSGAWANYLITWNANTSTFTLLDTRGGSPDGQDQDSNIENFRFLDGVVTASALLNGIGSGGIPTSAAPGKTLNGGALTDQLYGLGGNDILIGNGGNDWLFGGGGNDLTYGGAGSDSTYGGAGNDTLIGDGGSDLLEGDDGDDWIYLANGDGSQAYGGASNDVLIATKGWVIEQGDDGNDTMFGSQFNDYFYGGTGNDQMFGGDGVDVLIGGASNDYFDGGQGVNYYFGGNGGGPGTGVGNDTFVVNGVPSVQVIQDWTPGLDTVQFSASGFTSFADVLSHSYQNGAYFVVQVDTDTAVWLNGATAGTLTPANFSIVG